MPDPIRFTGMPQAIPDGNTEDIRFVLDVKDDSPINCVTDYEGASQIASGLGQALYVLRATLASKGSIARLSVERLSRIYAETDFLSGSVV